MHFSLLSADLILLILEATDPESLLQFCRVSLLAAYRSKYIHTDHITKASRWIYYFVMETKTLRYQVELALSGMKDGPPSDYPAPVRLEQLLTYKNAWPELCWSHEDRLEISRPTIMGVSGGFLYHASENSGQHFQWTLELYELRSFRTGRPPSHLRRFRFNFSFDIANVVIDLPQNLLVLVELDQLNGYLFSPPNSLNHMSLIRDTVAQTLSVPVFGATTCVHVLCTRVPQPIYLHFKPVGGVHYVQGNMSASKTFRFAAAESHLRCVYRDKVEKGGPRSLSSTGTEVRPRE